MTKSRSGALWLFPSIALAAPVAAQDSPEPAEDMIAAQRTELRAMLRPGCVAADNPDEIVVCATRDDRQYRVPPSPVVSGARTTETAGGAQLSAMEVNTADRCSAVGRAQQCGYVDFLGMGVMIVTRLVEGIAARQD
jgi:hypothetical protein